MFFSTENILLIGSVLLFVSLVAGKTGYRFGVPALLLFLVVGMLFGSDGLGIQFNNPTQAQFIGMIALSIILFSGGMDTKMNEIRPIIGEGVVLATFGVFITAFITGAFIFWTSAFTGQHIALTLTEALLLASVMSSTDSASVFSILRSRKLHLKHNLRPMLELESGSNDPMAYLLTILFIQMIQSAGMSFGELALQFSVQLGIGAVCGYLLGRLAVLILNKINIQYESLYPVLLLALVFFIFSFTNLLHGNGYLAVYISGVIVGNRAFVHKRSVTSFFDGFAWLCQIVMFLTLGLLVNPHELLGVATFRTFSGNFPHIRSTSRQCVSVPASVPQTSLQRTTFRFMGRLAGCRTDYFRHLSANCRRSPCRSDFNVVFFITILSLIVQGMSIPSVAQWLGLGEPAPKTGNTFGMALPEEIKSAMSEIEITEELLQKGELLMNLPLPDNTLVAMIKRNNNYMVPKGKTRLCPGDKLLVISDNDKELINTYESLGIKDYTFEKN